MHVRRRLTLAERPYAPTSSEGRTWHGDSAYPPKNLAMVLAILRVACSDGLVDSQGKTPAVRPGLANAPGVLQRHPVPRADGLTTVR